MLSTPRSIFSNMYFLAALIIVAILLIAALKFFFTYIANQYSNTTRHSSFLTTVLLRAHVKHVDKLWNPTF